MSHLLHLQPLLMGLFMVFYICACIFLLKENRTIELWKTKKPSVKYMKATADQKLFQYLTIL